MRILFLYSEYVNYLDGLMRCLVMNQGATVHVVSWNNNLLKPSNLPEITGVTFQKRSELTTQDLIDLIESFDPNLVYISGWMDHHYLTAIGKASNRRQFVTVCGFDDNWVGSLRQWFGSLYFRIHLRKYFDKAWVAGSRQYHYARKFGYADEDIAFNLLSCDTELFDGPSPFSKDRTREKRKFFYVGNFRTVKGTDLLADAYKIYREELFGQHELVCIGSGELRSRLDNQPGITILPYMTSAELIDVATTCDIFVFPSRKDQWGVALHEFALLGFPLISSTGVGSTERFLIDGYNGLMFKSGDVKSLAHKMLEFDRMSFEDLATFARRSKSLGKTITSQISASSFVSLYSKSL